jgi:hypothetical protein
LTVAEVALGTGLTVREATGGLDDLVRKGYADLHVSPSGVLVYHCFLFADAQDKQRAEQVGDERLEESQPWISDWRGK